MQFALRVSCFQALDLPTSLDERCLIFFPLSCGLGGVFSIRFNASLNTTSLSTSEPVDSWYVPDCGLAFFIIASRFLIRQRDGGCERPPKASHTRPNGLAGWRTLQLLRVPSGSIHREPVVKWGCGAGVPARRFPTSAFGFDPRHLHRIHNESCQHQIQPT